MEMITKVFRGVETMKVYARVHSRLTGGTEKTKKVYIEFKNKMEKYLLDSEMELYRVPIDTKEYGYAKELSKEYWDEEKFLKEDDGGKDGLEIELSDLYERVYDKKDYKKAVAYRVWFFQCSYVDEYPEESERHCCEENAKNGLYNFIQIAPFTLPRREFGKKNCTSLENGGYAVSKEVKEDLMQLGASEEDFWPVYTKKKEIVCYQLMPKHKVSLREVNGWKKEIKCPYCGYYAYWYDDSKPIYIDKTAFENLKALNATEEIVGSFPRYIVNKETYEFLTAKYKRMNFEPIFLNR